MPRDVRKKIGYGPAGLEPPAGARNRKTSPQIVFNNPGSSTKPESLRKHPEIVRQITQ